MSVCIVFCLCCTYINRVDSILFTYLPGVAMLALPNTLLQRWEFTCLISLMKRIQHSTLQPSMDTCQWWNTWSKVLDLMSKTRTRSACKHSSLMTFLVSFLHGYLYSVKYHTVPYMYYSPIIVHEWQQSGLTLEVFFSLSACNYKRPHLRMYVIIIG